MCGAKHMMENKADCTRTCVSKGSSYALVVGDKVYTLHTSDKVALDQLNTLAGEKAKVSGTADGDTIEVSKVTSAK
jgi:endonuclease YncB( thermonuclease family)